MKFRNLIGPDIVQLLVVPIILLPEQVRQL